MKVAILGASGSIGQSLSLLLKMYLPKNSKIFLYDINPITEGLSMDLSHVCNSVKVYGYYGEKNIHLALKNVDIVLISAGMTRKIGMNRSDLLNVNIDTLKKLLVNIAKYSPNSLINIITNPINTLVVFASRKLKSLGINCTNKLFGITKLDLIRAKYFVSKIKKNIDIKKIHVPVIGGHSNITIVPIFSQINPKINFYNNELIKLTNYVQNAGDEIIKAKKNFGSASLSMAYAAASFTLSLVKALKGNDVIEYAYIENHDIKYTKFIARPIVLNKYGIKKYFDIKNINDFEKENLKKSLQILENDIYLAEKISLN